MEELEKVFVKTIKSGKYTGTLEWYKKEGILIDNCFRSVVRDETGEIVKIIDKKRPVPDKIRPDHIVLPPVVGEKELYYFDPNYPNPIYLFSPPLKKPVVAWVVRAEIGTYLYDAVTGKKIGEGVPPPTDTFCTSGLLKPFGQPEYDPWANYRKNAASWFKKLGLAVEEYIITPGMDIGPQIVMWEDIREKLKSNNLKYFYIIAHTWRASGIPQLRYDTIGFVLAKYTTLAAEDIRECFKYREPMRFAFLASCHGMDQDGRGPLSEAFRKGKMRNTVTIGYKNMTDAAGNAASGWQFAYNWQDELFRNVYEGKTWKDAFDLACALYPKIVNNVVFCGDTAMRLVPTTAPEPPKEAEFELSEVAENHLPEWITGYACAACTGPSDYKCPFGYKRTECRSILPSGSHGCGSHPKGGKIPVVFVKCESGEALPSSPAKTHIEFRSIPQGAEIWLKKH